ncbi:MAG: SPOR domain-containing protein [Planctomycetes bacterium]|nr:SPOR domain-containing protein [Planctomycetota bacterium]
MLRSNSWLLALPLAAVPFLSGCGPKKTGEFTTPPDSRVAESSRPAELNASIQDIRAGRCADAEARMQAWLEDKNNLLSPFRPEGHYLLGQAQFGQGKYKEAKVNLDLAEDKARDRTTKALAQFARADCNYALGKYSLAIDQYMWIEQFYRDVTAVPHDELLFKLGMTNKKLEFTETADYWFNKVIELYATGKYAEQAKLEHSKLGPGETGEPKYYTLEVGAFSDEKKALTEAEIFRQKGYRDVRVEPYTITGNPYYGVYVGRYFNKNDAKRAKEDAELSGLTASIKPGTMAWPK